MKYFSHTKVNKNTPVPTIPWRMYILICVTGLLFTGMVGYGFQMAVRMKTVFTPLVNDTIKIRLKTRIAAMMFEEMLSSGLVWDFETNWEPLDQAIQEIQKKIEENRHQRWIFAHLRNVTTQEEIKNIADTLVELKKLARKRLAVNDKSVFNIDVNRQYQQIYADLISLLNRLEDNLRLGMEENSRRFRYTQMLLLAACFMALLTAGIAFSIFERRKNRDLLSLFHAKEMMKKEIKQRKLVEQALYEQTHALEQSNRDLEQYTHVVSHDLQEPLNVVISYLQLLNRRYSGRLDNDADEFIGFAVDGVQRMQSMIKALLMFSRIDRKSNPIKSVSTENILNQSLENLSVTIQESKAVITHDRLPKVMANESLLIQLFQNLISNAIKFRGEEQAHIHISAELKIDKWIFSVQDNGIGINPKFLERIFTIFKRLHTVAEYPGTGIGLAICRKIVESYGGRIWVTSDLGKGSTFFFSLPRDEVI